jgi:hypothetical protein
MSARTFRAEQQRRPAQFLPTPLRASVPIAAGLGHGVGPAPPALVYLKSHRYPRRVRARERSHGSKDDGPQMLVHFIGGDDETRTSLLNLSPLCGIEDYQPDFIPLRPTYHRHSLWSNSLASVASSMSSSCSVSLEARNASSQPWRGWRPGEMIRQSFATQLDCFAQPALLDEGLGNADATRVADANQLDLHAGNTSVITL